ncbi:MAG: Rieske (2Fe-2S) protein [Cyanobacteria bacterium HKST-UBA06]|nr:Rieske (2Fe-2S) protein [Cyanobacteria bacterium HKST-UBA04]MCA9806669.1 Rieske (2Fe-2S) protein [Cyanobacteria bacterium HKST-UBA06]MCA9842554.1 Rieske (2Fe-2S) protein [Cyanobacteria bacterium HKST-UBA03]
MSSDDLAQHDALQADDKLMAQVVSRRTFLKATLGLFAAGWVSMMVYPFFRYLTSSVKLSGAEEVTSVSLGGAETLAPGTGKNFQFGSKPALIVRDTDGTFHAYDAMCTHLGCTVQFKDAKDGIWCACHGGKYDPSTGKNIAGPPPKPLAKLDVAVVEGNIIVSKPGVTLSNKAVES